MWVFSNDLLSCLPWPALIFSLDTIWSVCVSVRGQRGSWRAYVHYNPINTPNLLPPPLFLAGLDQH